VQLLSTQVVHELKGRVGYTGAQRGRDRAWRPARCMSVIGGHAPACATDVTENPARS